MSAISYEQVNREKKENTKGKISAVLRRHFEKRYGNFADLEERKKFLAEMDSQKAKNECMEMMGSA